MRAISKSYNELSHYGILGMKWGVRRKPGPNGLVSGGRNNKIRKSGFTKDEEKAIKRKKNELINGLFEPEVGAENYSKMRMLITEKQVDSAFEKSHMLGVKTLDAYAKSKAKFSNEYMDKNPDKIPAGLKIKYIGDANRVNTNDYTMKPDYTYNGKPVSFQFKVRPDESDRVLLEKPITKRDKELHHNSDHSVFKKTHSEYHDMSEDEFDKVDKFVSKLI